MTKPATGYTISEVGFVIPKTFPTLSAALRRLAKAVQQNERDGESNYFFVRNPEGQTILHLQAEGASATAHTAAVLARAAAHMAESNDETI